MALVDFTDAFQFLGESLHGIPNIWTAKRCSGHFTGVLALGAI